MSGLFFRAFCASRLFALFAALTLTGFLVAGPNQAKAANITYYQTGFGSTVHIIIEGDIAEGDSDRFAEIAWRSQGRLQSVYLFSNGGDFTEGIMLGRMIRELKLVTIVPSQDENGNPSCEDNVKPEDAANCICASACFLIYLGGVARYGDYLAVHRARYSSKFFAGLSPEQAEKAFALLQAEATDYMNEMDVPHSVQDIVNRTPSDDLAVLTRDTIKTHFTGLLPYLDEWILSKCPLVADYPLPRQKPVDQPYRMGKDKMPGVGRHADGLVSATQPDALSPTQKACIANTFNEMRRGAFKTAFKEDANDHRLHKFELWGLMLGILGEDLEKLPTLDFIPYHDGKPQGVTFMMREAGLLTPAIMASDLLSPKKGVITTLNIRSHYNPSDEYLLAVILEVDKFVSSEGKRMKGSGLQWLTESHSIRLSVMTEENGHDTLRLIAVPR
ncbi:MAG: hypothetical protein AAGE89_01585 [Pseudomonadota bacterium]